MLHAAVAVGGAVDADHDPAARERLVVADDEHVLLDAADRARDDAAELRVPLAAEAVRADHHQVVLAARRPDEPGRLVLVFGHDPAVGAELHVAAAASRRRRSPWRDVRIEADQAGQAAFAAVHLADDLLVVDPFEQLPRQGTPALSQRLPTWSRKLSAMSCRPFSISLSWILRWRLISSGVWNCAGRPGLELAEAHVVEPRRVDVVGRDAALRELAELDRAVDRPVGVLRIVHGHEDFPGT